MKGPPWESSRWRLTLVLLVSLKVAVLIVLVDWTGRSLNPFDLTKSLFSRGMEWLIAGVLVVVLVRYGVKVWPSTGLHLAVALFLLANAVSAVAAESQYIALFGAPGKYLGLTFIVDMAVLYLAVAAAFRTGRDWSFLLGSVIVAFLMSGAYAGLQIIGRDPLPWTLSPRIRPFSTIGNADTYAQFLSVVIAAGAGGAILYGGARPHPVRAAAAAIGLAALALSAFVATRATVLGILVAFVVPPLIYRRLHGAGSPGLRRLLAGLALVAAAAGLVISISPLGLRVIATAQGAGTRERVLVWQAAIQAFADRPLFGYGVDNFALAWPLYTQVEFVRIAPRIGNDSAHSWLLQAAATTGLVGLAALLALQFASLRALAGPGLAASPFVSSVLLLASTSYWAHGIVSVGTVAVDWVPWVATGGAAAIAGARPALVTPLRSLHPLLVVALVAAAAGGTATGARGWSANQEALATRQAADLGQGAEAVAHGLRSVEFDSRRADYWNELGRGYFASAQWLESADAFQAAHERAPYEATFLSNRARALARLALAGDRSQGGLPAAIATAEQATALDRNNPEPLAALAEVATALGQPDVALRASAAAYLLQHDARYLRLALAAAASANDLPATRSTLEELIAVNDTAALRVSIAQVALRQDDGAAALVNARRALELEPGNPAAKAIVKAQGG